MGAVFVRSLTTCQGVHVIDAVTVCCGLPESTTVTVFDIEPPGPGPLTVNVLPDACTGVPVTVHPTG